MRRRRPTWCCSPASRSAWPSSAPTSSATRCATRSTPVCEARRTLYRITVGDGRSTEALVAAGHYGYAHSAVISENFPARHHGGPRERRLVLLEFDREVTVADVLATAALRGLRPPTYEDALYFGIAHPEVQRQGPVVFVHEPWLGHFGRRDVLCLWDNAGRRELGLDGYDDTWGPHVRFAFVTP